MPSVSTGLGLAVVALLAAACEAEHDIACSTDADCCGLVVRVCEAQRCDVRLGYCRAVDVCDSGSFCDLDGCRSYCGQGPCSPELARFDGCHCAVVPEAEAFGGQRFQNAGGGVVDDALTGLQWSLATSVRSWTDARLDCQDNRLGLPGTGWRLPTPREALLALDLPSSRCSAWPAAFGDACPTDDWLWTAGPGAFGSHGRADHAVLSVRTGEVAADAGSQSADPLGVVEARHTTRCVRYAPDQTQVAVGAQRFIPNDAHTVLDRVTGLEWDDGPTCERCTWDEAWVRCANDDGWRLPTLKEALTWRDWRSSFGGPYTCLWTSTVAAGEPSAMRYEPDLDYWAPKGKGNECQSLCVRKAVQP